MHRVMALLLILAVLVLPSSVLAAKRVALVVGISDYEALSKLNNPVPDAKAIAQSLKSHGFEVTEYYDLSRAELLDALEEFAAVADQASVALVYYAGHGMQMAGKNVIAPKDMEIDCERKTPKRAVNLDVLFSAVAGAPQQVVMLDACRNDPFPQCPKRSLGGGGGFRGFTRVGAGNRSLLIANSTLGGQLAADGSPGEHSPFAKALLARFSTDASSYLRDLLEATAADVQRASRGGQVPEIVTRGGPVRTCLDEAACSGNKPTLSSQPAPPRPVSDPAVEAWNATKETKNVRVLEAFIERFGDSFYAELAKAKLAELRKKEKVARVEPTEPPVLPAQSPRPSSPRENCSFSGNATFCVSSALAPAHGNRYDARNLIDGSDRTAWVEGSGGQGIGDFVVIEFDAPRLVRGLIIHNGYAKNADIFGKNSRVKDVTLNFSNGDSIQARLTDQMGEQRVSLNKPIKAKWVQLVIRSVYPGWKYTDTALNELRVDAQ